MLSGGALSSSALPEFSGSCYLVAAEGSPSCGAGILWLSTYMPSGMTIWTSSSAACESCCTSESASTGSTLAFCVYVASCWAIWIICSSTAWSCFSTLSTCLAGASALSYLSCSLAWNIRADWASSS